MSKDWVRYERNGPIATITLNRPETLNALSESMEDALHARLDEAVADEPVRAIVLRGAGRAFCAGYDISSGDASVVPPERTPTSRYLKAWWDHSIRTPNLMMHVMTLEKPVIAAVHGWCIGAGFWYALACDITIVSESAVFAQTEVRGVSNTTALFAALAGWKAAHRYALTGDHFDAAEALRLGVVNEVVADDELIATAEALARRLALVPRDAVRINKAITSAAMEAMGLRNALNVGAYLSVIVEASDDTPDVAHLSEALREGDMGAFLKARDGPFRPEPFGPRSEPKD